MSNSVRAWALLVVTLCLGIAIGLLGAGALQDRRSARVNDLRRPGSFIEHVQRVIRPTSDSQWNAIRPVVEAAAERNATTRRAHDSAMRAAVEAMKAELQPLLNDEQRERLSRFVPGRPPGPGGPGGRRGRGRDGGPPGPPDDRGPPPPP